MDSDSRFVITPRTVLGLSIALLGILLTLDRLGVMHIDNLFRRFWPVPIILMGGLMIVQGQEGRERMRGIVITVIGTWLFLNMQGLVSIRFWELFWPLLLVLVGVNMAMRRGPDWSQRSAARLNRRYGRNGPFGANGPFGPRGPFGPDGPMGRGGSFGRRPPQPGGSTAGSDTSNASSASAFTPSADPSGHISMFSVWSNTRRATTSTTFQGGDITAIMGGAQLDLRMAAIPAGQDAVLDITAVMGGVEIFVPNSWEVSTPILPFMGAVEDERLPPIQQDPNASRIAGGRLVIRGFVMMGGVTIKG